MYKGIVAFQSVADNYTDPKSSNTSQTYVMRCRDSRSAKGREQSRDDSIQLYPHVHFVKSNPA